MPILVDYNQVILASLFESIGNHHNVEAEENLVRHMFLNSLRYNRSKFTKEFGEIVICADGKNSWRKEIFPYYKANRKKSRESSELNWNELFRIINTIRTELHEFFPYKVIHLDHCEADDIIGVIVHEHGNHVNDGSEKFLILSGDKDYTQLHRYANVKQYDPVRKKWIENSDPDRYLTEHVLKGDSGDGVPNVLSPDNCLVIGQRQKMMTQKRLAELLKGTENMDESTLRNYYRNKAMIDLSQIPLIYKQKILEEYDNTKEIGREQLFNFFFEKKLKNLIPSIGDF